MTARDGAPASSSLSSSLRLPSLGAALAFIAGAVASLVLSRTILCEEALLSAPSTHFATFKTPWHRAPAVQAALNKPHYLTRYNSLNFNLTDAERRRGVWHVGSGQRLHRFADKLISGQPVKVLAIGGSVTAGHGLKSLTAAYPARFGELLNATFPHPETDVLNRAIGGTTSSIFSLCFDQLVPQDVHPDLVVIEFSINDGHLRPFQSDDRKSYEQLLRKLLRLPSRPAVVVFHYYAWWFAYLEGGDRFNAGYYWETAETELGAFDQYYDLPSLSLRAAVYHKLQQGQGIFRVDSMEYFYDRFGPPLKGEPAAPGTVFYHDAVHPSVFGHRIMAELLMELTWQAVTEAARSGREAGSPEQQGRVPRSAGGVGKLGDQCSSGTSCKRGRSAPAVQRGQQQEGHSQLQRHAEAAGDVEKENEELLPPMIPGNMDLGPPTCFMQEGFAHAVSRSSGFAYAPHRPDAPTFEAQKWSWTGTAPGDWAEFEVDTRENTTTTTAPAGSRNVTVGIGYLKSYESMGNAGVECVSGCTCDSGRLEGTWDTRATLVQSLALQATQHPKCRVRVTILPETSSGQHKISLTYLLVNPHTGWFLTQWLGRGPAPEL